MAAVAALAILGAGIVVPATSTPVVTGHTTFVDMESLDPCLGAVAGIVQSQVLWFDDAFLHERTNFENDHWIYASHESAGDPTTHVRFDNVSNIEENADNQPANKILVRSGVWYNFTDPNGVTWNVTEVFWDQATETSATVDRNESAEPGEAASETNASAHTNRHYAWIVQLGPTTTDPYLSGLDSIGDRYNFVTMVNSCKFSEEAVKESDRHHDAANETYPRFRHPDRYETNHTHETWTVDLRIGPDPDLVPLDAEPVNEVTRETVASFFTDGDPP